MITPKHLLLSTLVIFSAASYAETKIVGGKPAMRGAWPATVALLDRFTVEQEDQGDRPFEANYLAQFCAGTLIAPNWVLTAGHCVDNTNNDEILVFSGTSDLTSDGLRSSIKTIVLHPNYDSRSLDSDIALLELVEPVSQSTISIHNGHPAAGTESTVVGWGALKEYNDFPYNLQQVEVPIVDDETCRAAYLEYGQELSENMFCAGYPQGGKDSCAGDSGGPIMAMQNGEYSQVGIVSWGIGCAREDLYGIYTQLSNFQDWVISYTNPTDHETSPVFPTVPEISFPPSFPF